MAKVGDNFEVGAEAAQTATTPKHDATDGGPDGMPTAKRTTSPAFQFYASNFLGSPSVMAMTMTERGVYITLLAVQWESGSIPADMAGISRLLKGINEKQLTRMWPVNLAGCFVPKGNRLVNPRLEEERRKQVEYRRRQSDNGKSGGRPKKETQNNPTLSSGFSETEPKKSSPSPIPSPSPEVHTHTPRPGAPIHGGSHKAHVACGRVCVPSDLHDDFQRALNLDDADAVLREWYHAVDDEWSVGAKRSWSVGGNSYGFWRARFNEKWPPAAETKAPRSRRSPAWAVNE